MENFEDELMACDHTRPASPAAGISRRDMLRKLGGGGGLALLFPIITSTMAPILAQETSPPQPGHRPRFQDMMFEEEVVKVQFGESVFEEFIIFGHFRVSPRRGVVRGSGDVVFPDGTSAWITIRKDKTEIMYGEITLNLLTNHLDLVSVNGEVVPLVSVINNLFSENTFVGIEPLGDLSRALVALQVLAQTDSFALNVSIAQAAALSGFWCDAFIAAAMTALLLIGAGALAALAIGCGAAGVTIPVIGLITCAVLGIIIAFVTALAFVALQEYLENQFWSP
jgi:hypothetical protein